jgi:hypothetical protein
MAVFSLSEATNLFKINYYKKSENMYNSANVLLGRVKKQYDFTGKERFVATPLSFSGGVGSGSLPTSGVANYKDALITSHRVYAVCTIEREAMKASADDKGAFVRATREVVQKCVESYMRNGSRILFGDGTGALGTGDNSTNLSGDGSTGTPFVVVISAGTWKEANWEERDFVNYASETSLLQVVEVIPSLNTVKLAGTSAGLTALIGNPVPGIFYMQGSKNNDPAGLKGVLDATSSTLFNIPVQRRWQATQKAAGGAGVTPDLMNEVMLEVERKFGKAPNLIVTSYTQYRKLLNQLEDHKRYNLPPRDKSLKGVISFEGVEFMSTRGAIGIFPERFCDADRMYFLNDNFIEVHHRPGFGWFDDDGTVFLRKSDSDAYEARYGGYYENFITPSAHGVITGLSV